MSRPRCTTGRSGPRWEWLLEPHMCRSDKYYVVDRRSAMPDDAAKKYRGEVFKGSCIYRLAKGGCVCQGGSVGRGPAVLQNVLEWYILVMSTVGTMTCQGQRSCLGRWASRARALVCVVMSVREGCLSLNERAASQAWSHTSATWAACEIALQVFAAWK